MSYAVYVYPDASGNQEKVRADELNWTGTWASTGTYFASNYDSVLYGNDRYITVTDNVGVNPTARLRNPVRLNPFSLLVVFQAGSEPPFSAPEPAPPTQDTVYAALTTAWAGTAAAQVALETAWAGTAAAYTALETAWAGTAAANQALVNSWAGTAAQATLAVGVSGTAWASFQVNTMPDTRLIFTNGILTAFDPAM